MAGGKVAALVELDSNFLVGARKAGSKEASRIENWLAAGLVIQVSAIAWSEYRCGPLTDGEIEITRIFITRIEPFTEDDAELAGALFQRTGRRSRSHADCMIAAHAIRREAGFATLNVQDFRPFEKLGLTLV